jgi:hypothetical protein
MRYMAVLILTICQFTAFPFLAIVASNTARQGEEISVMRHAGLTHGPVNVTMIYKTTRL